MDFGLEIKFPTTDKDWIKKIIIGGILLIIPIVNFIPFGYALGVMKGAIEGKPSMPEWTDWGNLFVKGLLAFVIAIIYMLIPIIVLALSAGGAVAAVISGNMAVATGALGGIIIGLLLALIMIFLFYMGIGMYVKTDSIGAAFKFGEILARIKSVFGDYLATFIVILILEIVVGIFNVIPLLGFLIQIFGGFYVSVVAMNMFGKLYAQSKA